MSALPLRVVVNRWARPVTKPSVLLRPWVFRFLNQEHDVVSLDDWNNPEWDKLWLYNLHYFDELNSADAGDRVSLHRSLLQRWIKENPVGVGNGWEPYPLSLRIVNWIKWALAGNDLGETCLASLAVQIRFLRQRLEYHLLGNHLFANAKALLFAGLFFEGQEAETWLGKGLSILSRQIQEQVLSDGGHFERSPMYHAVFLEDMLDLLNGLRAYGDVLPEQEYVVNDWERVIKQMRFWLQSMCHPDGQISLFNDAAFGIAPLPEDIEAYAIGLGLGTIAPLTDGLVVHKESGYVRWQRGETVAILDVGCIGPDYIPGHAHADTLSFELSLYGRRVVIDSGTSCYGISSERLRQRGTAAHNTVTINDKDSSEVWGGFRVARRAKPMGLRIEQSAEDTRITCSHNGYKRLSGKPVHHREWHFSNNKLTIKDTVTGRFDKAVARFHFHPDMYLSETGSISEGVIGPADSDKRICWNILNGDPELRPSSYHPEFGVAVSSQCLEVKFNEPHMVACFSWD